MAPYVVPFLSNSDDFDRDAREKSAYSTSRAGPLPADLWFSHFKLVQERATNGAVRPLAFPEMSVGLRIQPNNVNLFLAVPPTTHSGTRDGE